MNLLNVGIVGAMGAVGAEIRSILEEREFPLKKIRLFDIRENAGKTLPFNGENIAVEIAEPGSFQDVDITFLAVDASISEKITPQIVEEGSLVIDNSSCWRLDPNVPLVVPEVNADGLPHGKRIFANPNCSTTIALMAVYPIHRMAKIKRMIVSTYQAVSGAGIAGISELMTQTREVLNGQDAEPKVFSQPIAFNLIPQIDQFCPENGYTKEEMKLVHEGRKILNAPGMMISCTCVRVPVIRSHSLSITIETEEDISLGQIRDALNRAPGVKLMDQMGNGLFPTPLDSSGKDDVLVGRIRKDISSLGHSISLWCCGDQIRKGAALNAVQIAESIIQKK